MNQKILVTGGTGFIGRHFVSLLHKERFIFRILSRLLAKDTDHIVGNLSKPTEIKKIISDFQPDIAVHLAWEGIPDFRAETSMRNLVYGIELFEMLAEIGCKKIISIGTCREYGQLQGQVSEEMVADPYDPFTASKWSLCWMGMTLAKEKNIDFIWVRPFYIYGPYQRQLSLVPSIIKAALESNPVTLRAPHAKHDFIFVEDIAKCLLAMLQKQLPSGIYNIGSGKLTNVQEIIQHVQKFTGKSIQILQQGKNLDTFLGEEMYADIHKTMEIVGWRPRTTLASGINKTVKAYIGEKCSI